MVHASFCAILKPFLIVGYLVFLLAACSTEEQFDGLGGGVSTGPTTVSIASLQWAAPTEREDNTPISMAEIASYRIYYGTAQGDYQYEIEIDDAFNDTVDLSFAPGTWRRGPPPVASRTRSTVASATRRSSEPAPTPTIPPARSRARESGRSSFATRWPTMSPHLWLIAD